MNNGQPIHATIPVTGSGKKAPGLFCALRNAVSNQHGESLSAAMRSRSWQIRRENSKRKTNG